MPVLAELRSFLRASLLGAASEPESASRRRRIVTGAALIAGAATLGWSLTIRPGDPLFYPATLGVAAIWLVGAFASGPLRLGHGRTRAGGTSRAVLQGLILGGVLLAIFLAGAVLVGRLPWLRGPVDALLAHAGSGALPVVAAITAADHALRADPPASTLGYLRSFGDLLQFHKKKTEGDDPKAPAKDGGAPPKDGNKPVE
mgnify:CR=1 FL=1